MANSGSKEPPSKPCHQHKHPVSTCHCTRDCLPQRTMWTAVSEIFAPSGPSGISESSGINIGCKEEQAGAYALLHVCNAHALRDAFC
eukprot:661816-Pelagomonas_calceolata.AAC.2